MGKLFGSLKRDSIPVDQSPQDWRDAKNMVLNKKTASISVEDGFGNITPTVGGAGTLAFPSGTTKNVIGFKYIDGVTIYAFGISGSGGGEIGIVREDNKYYPILKDTVSKVVLDLDRDNPTQIVAEKKFNDNLIIVFKDRNGIPKILNLDCPPFRIATDHTVEAADLSKAQALIRLFPYFKKPIPSNFEILEGQGALTSGAYYPVLSYESYDGSVTPWTRTYNGFPIFAAPVDQTSTAISGGQKGEGTNKAARITLTNVDTNYAKLRVGYIYVSNGITSAFQENSFPIGTSTTLDVLITGSHKVELTLDEVLVSPIVYDKVETMTSLQKVLYLANVETPTEYNFQTYANAIVINWIRDKDVRINNTVRGGDSTYQNPKKVFFDKSFKSGEVMAFYLTINWINGTTSKGFHIPGRNFSGTDKDVLVGAEYDALDSSNDVYKYQVLNTHGQTTQTKGAMGFWENENEEYPVDPDNPTTAVHPDFANIPGISFAERKVRHHVFPDLTYLDNGANTEKWLTGTLSAYPTTDMESKIFGIEVSNVEIPAAILPYIVSWEIHFAKRDNSNIRVVASDCPSKIDSGVGGKDYFRFQPFDLMVSRASLLPTYIKPLMELQTNGATANQYDNFVEDLDTIIPFPTLGYGYNIVAVEEALYLGEDTTTPYNNAGLADNIVVKTTDKTTPTYLTPGVGVGRLLMYDLCIYRRDMYLGFQNQTLVSTGYAFAVTASGVQSAKSVYGGDVYINRHSVEPNTTGTQYMSYVCESAANIGLRNEDIGQAKYFAPKYSNPSVSWYGYTTDYNCINDFAQLDVYFPNEVCTQEDVTIHKNRVPFSATESTENSYINWRIFKVNSYYDSVNDKGEIWNILGQDRILYIHHKYSLFIAEAKDTLNTVGEEIALRVSSIFDRPAREVLPSAEGLAGTQSKFSCILCKLGYCFIDKQAKKVYIFNHEGLREVSKNGLEQFFIDHTLSMDDILLGGKDNPFGGEGYCMGYDELHNRLFITKRAMNFGSGAYEFTISFSPEADEGKGGWVSFHDYYPSAYISVRGNLNTINNYFSDLKGSEVFRHNVSTVKAKYYDGVTKESYIDIISNEIPDTTKEFESIAWITNVEKDRVNYPNDTFTHMMVYNETQCSGKLSIKASVAAKYYAKDVRNVVGSWFYNNFRDFISNPASAFLDEYNALIAGNIDATKPWYKRSKFISKYVVFRLISDNIIQKDLHFSSFSVKFKKSTR